MTAVFHREEEIDALRKRFAARKSVLLHGPSGVGKTLLLEHVMPDFPHRLVLCAVKQFASGISQLGRGVGAEEGYGDPPQAGR